MKKIRRCTRILILSLLVVSVFIPICILSEKLKLINVNVSMEFVEDLSVIKYRTEAQSVIAVEEDERTGVKVPNPVVYKDKDFKSDVILNSSDRTNNSSDSLNFVGSVDFLRKNVTNLDQKEVYHERQEKKLPTSGGKVNNPQSLHVLPEFPVSSVVYDSRFTIHEPCANVSSFQMKDP